MRVGPGKDYKVEWLYMKRGLPLEIVQEFDTWRKVRDSEGAEGWVFQSLLSGERTAIVRPWSKNDPGDTVKLRDAPTPKAGRVALVEPGVLVKVDHCEKEWCKVKATDRSGYLRQIDLWGVYPGETVE